MSKNAKKPDMISAALKAFQAWRNVRTVEKTKTPAQPSRKIVPKPDRLTCAVEYFESNTKLNSIVTHEFGGDGHKKPIADRQRDNANYEGAMRRQWARRFRDLVEESQITPLRSPDFGGVSGGSFGSKTPADHAIECGKKVGEIQQKIHPQLFKLLTDVFVEDKFVWEKNKAAIPEIRMALDFVGWCFGDISAEDVARRWQIPDRYMVRAPRRWAAGFEVRMAARRRSQAE